MYKRIQNGKVGCDHSGYLGGVILILHSLFFEVQRKKKNGQKKEPNDVMVNNLVYHLKSLVATSLG